MRRFLRRAFNGLAMLLLPLSGCVYVPTPNLPPSRPADFRRQVGPQGSQAPIRPGVSLSSVTDRLGEPSARYGTVLVYEYATVRGWRIPLFPPDGWLVPSADYRSHYLFLRFDPNDKLVTFRVWSQPYTARQNDEGQELKRFIADTDPQPASRPSAGRDLSITPIGRPARGTVPATGGTI